MIQKRLRSLTLPTLIPDEEKKFTYIFIFTLLRGASKGFIKILKAFVKPFEGSKGKVRKEKFKLIFILISLSEMHGAGRAKHQS